MTSTLLRALGATIVGTPTVIVLAVAIALFPGWGSMIAAYLGVIGLAFTMAILKGEIG